jgi:large repetitive protein
MSHRFNFFSFILIQVNGKQTKKNQARSILKRTTEQAICLIALALAVSGVQAQSTFPASAVGTPTAQQAVTIPAQAAGTVARAAIVTLGQAGLDFAVPAVPASSCAGVALTVGGVTPSCNQSVVFTPTAPGLRLGAVELFDSSGDLLGETLISGVGTGGLAVLVPGNVLPFAGNGNYLDPVVDNIPALNAELYSPTSVAKDGAGNLYIADSQHNRIRVVSAATGQISTIAGTGTANYTGDNAAAASATLNMPSGIALDGAGNLFIADTGNNAVRRVDAVTRIITTVAGNGSGLPGYAGDGALATSATVLLNAPQGVTVDPAGNLYLADTNNQVIRKVAASSGDISTVAGKYNGPFGAGVGGYNGDGVLATSATLNQPYAVILDAVGDLLIADAANNRIRAVNATTQIISTVAGDGTAGASGDNGPATQAELNAPTGIALDPAGNLYIGDTQNYRIRKVSSSTLVISTLAQSGAEYLTGADEIKNTVVIKGPQGLIVDSSGNVFFANTLSMQVWEIESNLVSLDFTAAPIRQGNLSAAQFQEIENDGNDTANPLAFTSIAATANAQVDTAIAQGECLTTQPLAVDGDCAVGVIFAPGLNPVLTANTTEAGTVSVSYTTMTSVAGPDSPLAIVAVGIAEPLTATTTTVSATPDPSLFSQNVTITVQVTTGTGTGALTGTVSIFDTFGGNKVTLASGLAVSASGTANFSIATLAVGVHSITASYSGDSVHGSSTSTDDGVSPWSQIVEEQTAVSLTSSVNPSLVGQSVTFTATVTAPNGGGLAPDGSVSFLDGTTTLSTVPLNGGVATYTTATLANGVHPITAVYTGDINREILGETSAVLNQDVQATATIALSTSGSPSYYGNPVTFTAAITSTATTAAGGTVNFFDGNVKIGSGALSGLTPDVATFTTSTLALGTHTITATYAGDNFNTAAASPAISQVVVQTTTAVTETATPSPGIAGVPEAISATVKITNGMGAPTGLVTFTSGTTVLGAANLNTAGVAAINPVLAPGTYTIIAAYAGDTDDAGSQSAPLSLTVNQAQTTTVVTVTPNPASMLAPVTFSAAVTGTGATPTGTVEFFANGGLIGSGALNLNGVATLTYSNLTVGTYSITATYEGDTNDAGSTSAAVSLTIGKIPTTTDLGSAMTSGANPQLTLVATVVGNVGPVPTGTVTFTNAMTTLGTATLDATGVASINLNLPAGTYVIQAAYSGDAIHLASTSAPITVTTNPVAFTFAINPAAVSVKSSQYAELGIVLTSVGGFTDTIGLGCVSLPAGVNCQFSSPSIKLAANGTATAQLTLDTNSPLTGGTEAMNRHAGGGRAGAGHAYLAGLLLPISILFGCIFYRWRKRSAALLAASLLLALSALTFAINGCNGISLTSAPAGTFTIQVVASGANTGVVESQTVNLTITQ